MPVGGTFDEAAMAALEGWIANCSEPAPDAAAQ
jgi:hypothetical protein